MSEEEEEYEIPPFDIQIEILKRLPVKSLMKFTAVSKPWKSVIHSSRFIADYNGRHIQQPRLIFVGYDHVNYVDIFSDNDGDDISFFQRLTLPLPMSAAQHPGFRFNKLIGYSHGLFGFQCYNNNEISKDAVVICNPSIRKSVFIPVPNEADFVFTVCNASDPMIFKTTYIVGCGWEVEIFRLSTGCWRTLCNAPPPRESLQFTRMRVVIDNRFIHWIVYDKNLQNNLILSLDISSEQFTESCLPPTLATHTCLTELHLSELRESLVVLEEDLSKHEVGVWMMMMEPGVQNSFTKIYTLKPPYTRDFLRVLGFRKNDLPIVYVEFPSYKDTLLFYEPDLKRFNDIKISGYGCPSIAGSYMETLLLLNH